MLNRYRLPIILAAALPVMAFGPAVSSADTDKDADASSPYETTGKVKRCIQLSQNGSPEPVNDRLFVFRSSSRKLYQNKVSKGCNQADNPFRRIQINVRSGMICSGEIINIVDNSDGITAGFCKLGDFEEVTEKTK